MQKTLGIRNQIILGLVFLLTTFRAISFFGIHGVDCDTTWLAIHLPCYWGNTALELLLWFGVLILLFFELRWEKDFKNFFKFIKNNLFPLLFVLFALLSLIWSIQPQVTLYRFAVLLMSTLLALYFGMKYSLRTFVDKLVYYFAIVSFASLFVVFIFPKTGIMQDPFYQNSWCGIFWHRNYFGCFMALGLVTFLTNLFSWKENAPIKNVFLSIMAVIEAFLLVKAHSATGIITAFVILCLAAVLYAWLKIYKKLKPVHYWIFGGVFVLVSVLVFLNLGPIFGLLGKDTSLTGRVPVWNYILQELAFRRPALGYGYGVMWSLRGIRVGLQDKFHWGAQVLIGDNGFLDILLHLGIIGLGILLAMIVKAFILGLQYLRDKKNNNAIFPILVLAFSLVANITLSLILESESFVWFTAITTFVIVQKEMLEQHKKQGLA